MEDATSRSPINSLRNEFRARVAPSDERLQSADELLIDTDSAPEPPVAASRRKKEVNTASQFSGALVPAQFKLPSDLVQSLKLHSINTGETMSDIVLRCLTSVDVLEKAWISTRKASPTIG